ncbi:MAG: hypothetical protein ACI9CE_001230, partial [Flavobacterium sp.]
RAALNTMVEASLPMNWFFAAFSSSSAYHFWYKFQ